jgi:hypothetical protein
MLLVIVAALALAGVIVWASYFRRGDENIAAPKLTPEERRIQAAIDKANHCAATSDCTQAGVGICPFGCYIHVYKDEVERIQSMLVDYQKSERTQTCMYMCIEYPGVDCVKGRCELRQP